MQVNTNQHIRPETVGNVAGNNRPARAADPGETVEFLQAEKLDRALALAPDTRAEKVERAETLLRDVHYPPQETIRRISLLLAMNWEESE